MKRLSLVLFLCQTFVLLVSGQTVTIFGDSYSTFEGYITPETNEPWYFQNSQRPQRTDVKSVKQTWWHQLITEQGWQLCTNNSYSGSTISYSGYDGADYTLRSFNKRMTNLGCPDIILVFGGTNDSWAGAPVGEYKYEGITQADIFSFRPALAHMLEYMTQRYINTRIYFILNDGLSDEIDESVLTICKHFGVPCIELENIDKLSGHPSVKGMRQIADQISAYLKGQ
ncbi:MAG: SGNH/GDSL hydrolase family protein [Prevotella sp.]|nr:SGNH/GDSL hydrolase family protein [Prevotella sp.]